MHKVDKISIKHGLEFRLAGVLKPAFPNSGIVIHLPADPLPDQLCPFLGFPLTIRNLAPSCVRRALPEKFVLRVVA